MFLCCASLYKRRPDALNCPILTSHSMASDARDLSALIQYSARSLAGAYSSAIQYPALLLAVAVNLLAFLVFRYINSPWRKVPPGPVGYPVIGSAHRFFDSPWLFHECPKYGTLSLDSVGHLYLTSCRGCRLSERRRATDRHFEYSEGCDSPA